MKPSNIKSDEQGSVLVVALLILVLLTIIGIAATSTTNIETQIAGNEKSQKIAFYNADSGVYPTAKVIGTILDRQAEPTDAQLDPIVYLQNDGITEGADGTLFRELMGYDDYESAEDIEFTLDSYRVGVDIERTGSRYVAGGGVEFASGAEGIGVGSGGGIAIYYEMNSTGDGPANSQSNIAADYRKVIGVPGGL